MWYSGSQAAESTAPRQHPSPVGLAALAPEPARERQASEWTSLVEAPSWKHQPRR